MNEAVHKEWCQPPCSTKSSHLPDSALRGRGREMLQIPDWGTWDSEHLHQNKERFLEVSKLQQVLETSQESRQALLRTEGNALSTSATVEQGTVPRLHWSEQMLCPTTWVLQATLQAGHLHSKVKNNLFLGNWSCCSYGSYQ